MDAILLFYIGIADVFDEQVGNSALHHERGYKTPELFRNYFVKGLLRIFFDLVIALEIAELGALDLD